jgi:hypothetical protein
VRADCSCAFAFCPWLKQCFANRISELCNLLSHEHTRQRVMETCFSDPVGKHFHPQIKSFKARVHRKRWGTVCFANEKVLELRLWFHRCWDVQKYCGGAAGGNSELGPKVDCIDQAVNSSFWWGKCLTLDCIYCILRLMFEWYEDCPCHEHLNKKDAPIWLQKRWLKCPRRAHRMAEICCGDLFEVLRKLCDSSANQLLISLPSDLSAEQRGRCVQIFERSRSHILFQLVLKLSFFARSRRSC